MGGSAAGTLEQEIKDGQARGELQAAAEAAIRGYGPEIYSFLRAFHRNETDADEVFAIFSERLWNGLPTFGWQCSFRTWAYTVARNAARNYSNHARVRGRVQQPLSYGSSVAGVAEQVRTTTATYLRTATKDRFAALRDSLSEEEKMLLCLRVDRQLEWEEVVQVLHDDGGGAAMTRDLVKRESARLRKRYQAIKEKLVVLARREGLIDDHR